MARSKAQNSLIASFMGLGGVVLLARRWCPSATPRQPHSPNDLVARSECSVLLLHANRQRFVV